MSDEYVLTDGKGMYISLNKNRYVPVTNPSLACVLSQRQADGILHNSLSTNLRARFYVKKRASSEGKVVANENKEVSTVKSQIKLSIKQVTGDDLENNTLKVATDDNIQKWVDKLHTFNGLSEDAKKRKEELNQELARLNAEIIDIEHWIEFSNFNAAQGYKASKEIKECRIKRRAVKNELSVLELILDDQDLLATIDSEITKKISILDNRTYHPRVRKDLFQL